jgi:hypothetical protein
MQSSACDVQARGWSGQKPRGGGAGRARGSPDKLAEWKENSNGSFDERFGGGGRGGRTEDGRANAGPS